MAETKTALLLTVGTGTAEMLEETVLAPFAKSLRKGLWSRVVLFPSQTTGPNADLLRAAHPDLPIVVRPLRRDKVEEDIDKCFEHFEREIARLIGEGFAPSGLTADFTRGTKAMSAGLALAAAAHGIGSLRYIGARERDNRGMALPGKEFVSDLEPSSVLERQLIQKGLFYLEGGLFRAAAELFPGWPTIQPTGPRAAEIQWLNWVARFWGAWDTFDYKAAWKLAPLHGMPSTRPGWLGAWLPTDEQLKLLKSLQAGEPKELRGWAGACRDLAADLLANARRRFGEDQTEEALLRLYRVLELIGQIRLFTYGLDSGGVDSRHPVVVQWLATMAHGPRANYDGTLLLGRENVAGLLAALGDPLAARLVDLGWLGEFQPVLRNRSILIHGFRSRTREKRAQITALQSKLEEFFAEEDAGNAERLRRARFPSVAEA